MVREYKGAFSGEHGDGLVRSEWVAWQFGPRLTRAFEEIKALFDPAGLMNPGKIVRPTRMDDATLFRFPPGYRVVPIVPALDWSAWNVQNDPVAETTTARRHRRRSRGRLRQGRRDVQQQRPLPQVRRRHDVPELPRHARRAASDARARQHAAPRAVRTARTGRAAVAGGARRARPVRELQGLPARMSDRRRHGEDEDRGALPTAADASPAVQGARDRASAALGAVRVAGARAREPAQSRPAGSRGSASDASASPRSVRCRHGGATRSCATRAPRARRPTSCCSSTRSPTISSRRTRTRRSPC